MKVAIVHDWFIFVGGSEKVVQKLLQLYPDADVYSLINGFSKENVNRFLLGKKVRTSFLQKAPGIRKYYRFLLPLFPLAIKTLDLSSYDLIISSSHSVAKGVKIRKGQKHICYIHTPVRYAWDMRQQYLKQIPSYFLKKVFCVSMAALRKWDLKSNETVNYFIANSNYVAERVRRNYKRESTVIYPPVDTDFFSKAITDGKINQSNYFVVVSRLVFYKRIDLVINAFNELPGLKLLIIGIGPQSHYLKSIAGKNITFLGYKSDEEIRNYFAASRAVIFSAYEDFGITPVEAQACGTPVIALGKGGYLETIIDEKTGILFKDQSVDSLKKGIVRFLELEPGFVKSDIIKHAEKFNIERFNHQMKEFINDKI